ncbi:monovalent cation:proton antiporter family protein [Neisseria chenwenguii]|uniref:monovalent cation:proton antiporter family protein n=1 Tax=Neisseria chenwenguii TaxID=1853278 RepID=UPI000F4DB381|nr:monovalent cation:proton antiporter family protein [Neisseria chenwenguii]ROV56042.1 potassium transporter [Neisseria chenwenguii]
MPHISLAPVVIVLLVSVITVIFCRKFNVPSMLGYLLVGFIAGPGMLSLIPKSEATDYLGEIGIVFLMFSIGLEFSLPKLKAMRRLVFGLGGLQVGVTMLAVMGVLMIAGTPFNWAFAVGGALAMSSTAIVSRLLSEKSELDQPHGQMAMGVLLMQDIAVVPLMILIPALSGGSEGSLWVELGLAALKMAAMLGILFVVGNKIMSPWFRLVAKRKSSELFMINVLLVTLGVAYLTESVGLSLALGAFVAGMLLSETEYRFQVEDDIRPFRDILLGFFFITVGMKLDIQALGSNWQMVLVLFAVLILLKALVIFLIARRMQHPNADSLKAALYLAQGGEFGFVMLAVSSKINMVSPALEQAATAAILLSMIAAPFLLGSSDKIVSLLFKSNDWDLKAVDLHAMLVETMSKSEHVLIIGFGRGGQTIGRILAQENIPYFALDLDAERVHIAHSAGEPVAFGDAKRREVLEAAGLARAKMVVLTINNMHETQHILDNIMAMHPGMQVYARAIDDDYVKHFTDMGAEEAVSDTKETSLALAAYAMLANGVPYNRVYQTLMNIRRSRYASLEDLFVGSDDETTFSEESHNISRHAFTLVGEAHAIGKSIHELPTDRKHLKLLFIRRNTGRIENPDPDFRFQSGDILVVAGRKEEIISFENWSLQGKA